MSLIEIQSDISGGESGTTAPYIFSGENMIIVRGRSSTKDALLYRRNQDTWTFVKKITSSITVSIATINNNIAVIADPWADTNHTNSGTIEIYHKDEGGTDNWGLVKTMHGDEENRRFGCKPKLYNNTLVVGASGGGYIKGKVYIYEKDEGSANNWGEVTSLQPTDVYVNDLFGDSCDIYGDWIVVGSYEADIRDEGGTVTSGDVGAIYIYKKEIGGWTEKHKKLLASPVSSDKFGKNVSIYGDYIAVMATGWDFSNSTNETNSGLLSILYKDQGGTDNWGIVQSIYPPDFKYNTYSNFGSLTNSLHINENFIIISSPKNNGMIKTENSEWPPGKNNSNPPGYNNGKAGCVYVYKKDDSAHTWSLNNQIFELREEKGNQFGTSVSMDNNNYVYVTRNASSTDDKYKVNSYKLKDGGIEVESKADVTTQLSSTAVWYGIEVDDNHLVATKHSDKLEIFKKNGENWTSVATIDDSYQGQDWGRYIRLSGDYLFVAATYRGLGDNTAVGAIYIYKKDEGGTDKWGEVHKIEGSAQGERFGKAQESQIGFDVDGDYVIVRGKSSSYKPKIYKKDSNADTWTYLTELDAPPAITGVSTSYEGTVNIKGDYVFIASPNMKFSAGGTSYGGCHIYKKDNGAETWSHLKSIFSATALGYTAYDSDDQYFLYKAYFGWRMAVDGDNLILMGEGRSALAFSKDEGGTDNWGFVSKLTAAPTIGRAAVGGAPSGVSTDKGQLYLKNNFAVMSFPFHVLHSAKDDNKYVGIVHLFQKDSNTGKWNHISSIVGDTEGEALGHQLAIDSDIIYAHQYKTNKIKRFSFVDAAAVAAAALAAANSASETALSNLNVSQTIFNAMKALTTVLENNIKKVTISTEIKNSIITSDGTQKETKTNIRKKRREFLKVLFANNSDDNKIKMPAKDIGLDETLKDTLGSTTIKENITVLKKNVDTAIDVSSETSSDTGIYAELDSLNDKVIFNVGGNKGNAEVKKTQDASSNTGAVDQWTISYDNVDYVKEEGEKITINGYTIYIGSVYIDGESAGIPAAGNVFDLAFAKIPFAADDNPNITSFSSNSKIREDRHTSLNTIWQENPGSTNFLTNSSDLGLDQTVGKPIKSLVNVYKAGTDSSALTIDLDDVSIINKNKGVYVDLSGVGDYVRLNTGGNDFRVKVDSVNPKKYIIQNADGTTALSTIKFLDGQWVTQSGITIYFGGLFTNGTDDGITAADPYVFPINGNPYKLPDRNANYCLYADENTFITGMVRQLPLVEQKKMRQWVIEKLGSDTNNGASLVTDGFFYSAVHVNTNIGELYLDLETKVCNTTNKGMFNVSFKNTRDNTELFKGEHKTTATISWKDNGNTIAVDVDFFENPQIRNGIRMNTVMTKSEPIGLLIEDYEPSLLRVKNPKNKLNKYERLVNKLELGHRVTGEKLNLQKEGEVWTRHKM